MTIAVEERSRAPGMIRAEHPALTALDEAIIQVDAAADTAIWGLSDDELTAAVERCEKMRAGAHAFELALVREADGRNLARRCGAASTAAWLTARFRIRPGQARSWVQLAKGIADPGEATDYAADVSAPRSGRELVETGVALAAGEISPEHAAVVDKIMSKVPRAVDAERAGAAEADLADYCRKFDPATVAKLGDYMLELMREDTLDDEEDDRHRRRSLRLDDHSGGLSGQLTREGMATLRSALDPLAAPNPAGDGTPDERSPGQRLADALVELARRAIASNGFAANHGMSHRVMVMIGLESLTGASGTDDNSDDGPGSDTADAQTCPGVAGTEGGGDELNPPGERATANEAEPLGGDVADGTGDGTTQANPAAAAPQGGRLRPSSAPSWATRRHGRTGLPAPAELEWGPLLSASAVLRLACHSGIQRIILDPNGAVLDVGRERRTATPAQFAALIARDGGCAFPGCTRPPSWCIAHHVKHWARGGATDLDNMVLLCGHHHRVVHHQGWAVAISDTDRLPVFYPPPWVDPHREPRRNDRPRMSVRDP